MQDLLRVACKTIGTNIVRVRMGEGSASDLSIIQSTNFFPDMGERLGIFFENIKFSNY